MTPDDIREDNKQEKYRNADIDDEVKEWATNRNRILASQARLQQQAEISPNIGGRVLTKLQMNLGIRAKKRLETSNHKNIQQLMMKCDG